LADERTARGVRAREALPLSITFSRVDLDGVPRGARCRDAFRAGIALTPGRPIAISGGLAHTRAQDEALVVRVRVRFDVSAGALDEPRFAGAARLAGPGARRIAADPILAGAADALGPQRARCARREDGGGDPCVAAVDVGRAVLAA